MGKIVFADVKFAGNLFQRERFPEVFRNIEDELIGKAGIGGQIPFL